MLNFTSAINYKRGSGSSIIQPLNVDLKSTIQILTQIVTNQANYTALSNIGPQVDFKVSDFLRMNPPEFARSKFGQDPQNIIDEVQQIFQVMHVSKTKKVDLFLIILKILWVYGINIRKTFEERMYYLQYGPSLKMLFQDIYFLED